MGFDNIEMNNCTWKSHSEDYYQGYEAGAASRQGEVDELQKRIDKALYKLPWLNWKNIDGKMKGEIMDILKGKKDE